MASQLAYAPLPAAWLILPTYNEAENIEALVRAVLPRLEESGADPRILIVDDGSPDGTGEIADGLAAELDCVEVLHRPSKQGLGRAYPPGLAGALRRRAGPGPAVGSGLPPHPAGGA